MTDHMTHKEAERICRTAGFRLVVTMDVSRHPYFAAHRCDGVRALIVDFERVRMTEPCRRKAFLKDEWDAVREYRR